MLTAFDPRPVITGDIRPRYHGRSASLLRDIAPVDEHLFQKGLVLIRAGNLFESVERYEKI